MRIYHIKALLGMIMLAAGCFAQNCGINNPIIIEKANIELNYIKSKISQNPSALYGRDDIRALNVELKKCQNMIDNHISELNSAISSLILDKQDLLKLSDIAKMKEQITAKKQSITQIQHEMEKDLSNISYKAIYLAVLTDIDVYEAKEKLSTAAEAAISDDAIRSINGLFISGLTIVENNMMIRDYIKAVVSGEMGVEKKYIATTLRKDKKFVYLAKVNVSPLKKPLAGANKFAFDQNQKKAAVLDLGKTELAPAALGLGETDDITLEIRNDVANTMPTIQSENDLASRRQQDVLSNGLANTQRVEAEIKDLQQRYDSRFAEIKRLITTKTYVTFVDNDIKGTIDQALAYYDKKIRALTDKKMMTKELELLSQNTNVIAEGEPVEDIAKTAINVAKQIETSYSKVEQFSEVTEVENNMLVNFETAQKKDIFRTIDKIWIYPIPGNNDNFELTVVAKFKINYKYSQLYTAVDYGNLEKEVYSPQPSKPRVHPEPVRPAPAPEAPAPEAPALTPVKIETPPSGENAPAIQPGTGASGVSSQPQPLVEKAKAPRKHVLWPKIVLGIAAASVAGGGYYYNMGAQTDYDESAQIAADYRNSGTNVSYATYAQQYADARASAKDKEMLRNICYIASGVLAAGFGVSFAF